MLFLRWSHIRASSVLVLKQHCGRHHIFTIISQQAALLGESSKYKLSAPYCARLWYCYRLSFVSRCGQLCHGKPGATSFVYRSRQSQFWKRYVDDVCTAVNSDLVHTLQNHVNSVESRLNGKQTIKKLFSVRPCSSVGRVTIDLIWRSWVRFPPRSKDFFFTSCISLYPFTKANAQWVIHGFK